MLKYKIPQIVTLTRNIGYKGNPELDFPKKGLYKL